MTTNGSTTASEADNIIRQLKQLAEKPESHDEKTRVELLRLSRSAARALETPQETTQRIIFSPLVLLTTRLGQDFNIFSALVEHSETNPASLDDLGQTSGLDKSILSALVDFLCGQDAAILVKPGFYAPTKLTHAMLHPTMTDAAIVFHDCGLPAFTALSQALKNAGSDGQTAFQIGHRTPEKDIYAWLESHPIQQGAFYRFMKTVFSGLPTWLDVVRFDKEVASNSTPEEVVFVDVGGGFGWQCQALKKAYPGLPGKVVLQDRHDVIAKAQVAKEASQNKELGIETTAYDFFTPQPVKDARAYFLREILHNWDDEKCLQILRHQADAMAAGGKSTLLIEDFVLGERAVGADYAAAFGIVMQAVHNARERSREDFSKLLSSVGLELEDVRVFTESGNSVIIARKP